MQDPRSTNDAASPTTGPGRGIDTLFYKNAMRIIAREVRATAADRKGFIDTAI